MQRTDFTYKLPEHLIAQYPTESRTGSRLLYIKPDSNQLKDYQFIDFPSFLLPNDLVIFNNTRVIPARLFGQKSSGGKIEILIERILDDKKVLVQLRSSRSPKPGARLHLEGEINAIVLQRVDNFFELAFDDPRPVDEILEIAGHIPLPPYIERNDTVTDLSRYQTVYAEQNGAVAAPTAGLHFDQTMLEKIAKMGIETAFVTLHVGAGTFSPMRVNDISQHIMHAEHLHVSAQICEQIKATRARGGRVVAIGTTTVRALETASADGIIKPYDGETRLFITPGYKFRSVDAMLTNFHLPESTLLMLVCAFAGQSRVLAAYQHAIAQEYRFFSYGDAMFLTNCPSP